MTQPDYRPTLIEYIRANAKPLDKFSHQPRLYRLATRLAEGKPFDDDVLFAAAWLHDLGVFIGHRPEEPAELVRWDHVAYAARQAPALLRRFGFPEQKIAPAIQAMNEHLPSATPTSFEAVLLRDADILEQLGAIGALRTISKISRDTRFIRFADALAALRRNVEQLPAKLQLDATRRLAEPRLRILRAFLDAAEAEADGGEL